MFDEPTRARRAEQPARASATRSPAAARAQRRRSARCGRCCATSSRSRTTSPARTRASTRLRRASSATRRASSRRRPRRRPSCSSTSTRRSRRCGAVARPFIQESITEAPPTLDAAIRDFPHQRPFLAQHRGRCSASCGPGARALRGARRRPRGRAERRARRRCARTPPFNARLELAARRAAGLRRGPARAARHPPPDRDGRRAAARRSTTWRPRRRPATTSTLWFRNVASLLSDGDANGTWQRFIIIATPQGPNNEGSPSRGARPNGPRTSNHLHTNPYPNTAAPGPAERVRGRQRAVPARPTVIGNVPGTQRATTERRDAAGDALMARRRRAPPAPRPVRHRR